MYWQIEPYHTDEADYCVMRAGTEADNKAAKEFLMDIDTLFQQWFENEFADNIDEGSRTHTNLHSAFDAGAQSVKPQLDALYKSNEELRQIIYAKDKEIERNEGLGTDLNGEQ